MSNRQDWFAYVVHLSNLRQSLLTLKAQGVTVNGMAVALGRAALFTAADATKVQTWLTSITSEMQTILQAGADGNAAENALDSETYDLPYGDVTA